MAVVYVLRQRNPHIWTFPKMGTLLGGRDHSTMKHAHTEATKLVETDEGFAKLVERLAGL